MRGFRNRFFALGDIILLAVAAYVSYALRLERLHLGEFWPSFALFTILAVVITPAVFWLTGIYSRYWHYATVEELLLLIGATTIAAALVGFLSQAQMAILPGSSLVPRSIPFIFLLVALAVTTGQRLIARLLVRYRQHPNVNTSMLRARVMPRHHKRSQADTPFLRVLVVGAGAAGSMIVRELQNNPQLNMEVVGFLDDDATKQNVRIHGVQVLGTCHDLPHLVNEYGIGQVIIAMPTASGKTIREIVTMCEQIGVETKIIPGIYELLGGKVKVSELRNVEVEDLLRREPVQIGASPIRDMVQGRSVLVTGAGGSIGSELCRQIVRCNPKQLVLVGHGENSIFEIDNELRALLAKGRVSDDNDSDSPNEAYSLEIVPLIADIRHAEHIHSIFIERQPQIVFHAAAHKHVPLMEMNPGEAIMNNVLGTRNLLDASLAVDVERFVMISTDKAVNPTSIMGASKRVAELLVHQASLRSEERGGKPYVAVRFGNVLGSRGSVVLTFKQQIAQGGPVTVTHPDMMRYFMTIPEAVHLVLQAASLGRGGEVFMLDMGEPVKIEVLARDLIELSGLQVGRDIDIVYTGIRPGEKLFEEMICVGEEYKPTKHEKIFIAGNTSSFVPPKSPSLDLMIKALEGAARRDDRDAILTVLQDLLPEFHPSDNATINAQQSEVGAQSVAPVLEREHLPHVPVPQAPKTISLSEVEEMVANKQPADESATESIIIGASPFPNSLGDKADI
jgi:FlaA1/EpsC-like NDP-sugar epimerase